MCPLAAVMGGAAPKLAAGALPIHMLTSCCSSTHYISNTAHYSISSQLCYEEAPHHLDKNVSNMNSFECAPKDLNSSKCAMLPGLLQGCTTYAEMFFDSRIELKAKNALPEILGSERRFWRDPTTLVSPDATALLASAKGSVNKC